MQQTRRELVDEVLRMVGEQDDDEARTLAEDLVNTGRLRIYMKHPWRLFRMPAAFEIATVANTRSYPLPAYFGRVPPAPAEIRNLSLGSPIELRDQDAVQAQYPRQGTSLEVAGTPTVCFIGGSVGVGVQPAVAAGEACTLVSTSAADTDIYVTIEGIDDNNRENRLRYQLNGTTPVSAGTWKKIIAFSKAYEDGDDPATERTSSRGNVTLAAATTGTLQVLLPIESAVDRPEITFFPKPAQAWTIAVPMARIPRRLIYDSDMIEPLWGPALRDWMIRNWRVSTSEVAEETALPWGSLLDLIAFENSTGGGRPGRGGSASSGRRY